jgi:DNA polymerase III delta prime subunit
MLTGKAIFLHGPTGTGKTSLARFAATHFTGENPEMVFCNPQTKESNVWGKTGIKPTKGGAIETVEIYGPLSLAMADGRPVIFDEFTALPKEQMVFIKGIFNAKVGDRVNITGNGVVLIKPGFQMIFTANLKSEKNPERQELPPEIAREFEQNNIKIGYTPPEEAYDIMLARLLNRDGSLDMSYHDLLTTLPNLCRVMDEIQESYTNQTGKDVIDRAGLKGTGGKVHSLKKFVMTQGSVEAILSSWIVEKQIGNAGRSFSEFLDERFKTALTFEEYSKEDRILAAKILASRGFLTTLTAKDIGLPDDVFTLNTAKALHGEEAVEELRNKSGDIKHLTLKEVAGLDPFDVQTDEMRKRAETLLGSEEKGGDNFSKTMRSRLEKLKKEKGSKDKMITVQYEHANPTSGKVEHQETISIDIEKKVREFVDFYKKTNIDLPPSFEQDINDVWERNRDEIQKSIEENGFDDLLLVPADLPLPDLADKMKMGNGYYEGSNFTSGGGFAGAVSQNVDKPRIILYHNMETLSEITKKTGLDTHLNITGGDMDKLYRANPDHYLSTLEDFLVLERKVFEDTGKHLSDWRKQSANWLPGTKAGARLVGSGWYPDVGKLHVYANDPDNHYEYLGARPSRSFF